MDWAEIHYPEYFPSREQDQMLDPYAYRYYPETHNYLGVAGGEVYLMGAATGGALTQVGSLAGYACSVRPTQCFDGAVGIVVSPAGDDSNAGTLASPYRTLAKALAAARPGDTVYLRQGIYREAVSLPASGEPGLPITLRSWQHERGTISGADVVRGWSLHSGAIYVAPMAQRVTHLFVDGLRLDLAQLPSRGYAEISSEPPDRQHLQSSALAGLTAEQLAGAGVHIRTVQWRVEDRVVVSADAGTIAFDQPTDFGAHKGHGYYLDNKLWMLQAPGQWFHDDQAGRLYVWLPDSSHPATHLVEATVRSGITSSARDYIAISGIGLEKNAPAALVVGGSAEFLVAGVSVADTGSTSLVIEPDSRVTVSGSSFTNVVRDAIHVDSNAGVTIQSNTFTNIGTVGPPVNSDAVIRAWLQSNVRIIGNTITNAGYAGIKFFRDSVVADNDVRNPCMVLNDCGGIYTWVGSPQADLGSVVSNNRVTGALGNPAGTPTDWRGGVGIYLDDFTAGVTVSGNTVSGSSIGIVLHNASRNTVQGNTLFANTRWQLSFAEDAAAGAVAQNSITGNYLFPTAPTPSIQVSSNFAGFAPGVVDANRYGTLYTNVVAEEAGVGVPAHQYLLSEWRDQRGYEQSGSAFPGFMAEPFTVTAWGSEEMMANGGFDGSMAGWATWSADARSSISPTSACGALAGNGCLQASASEGYGSLVISPKFSIVAGTSYVLAFRLRALSGLEAQQGTVLAVVRRAGDPYDSLGLAERLRASSEWETHRYLFQASASVTENARFDLELPAGAVAQLDDVSFRAVGSATTDTSVNQRLLVNPAEQPVALGCPEGDPVDRCSQYVDADGTHIQFPLTLPGRSSRILIWEASPFRKAP